VFGVGVFVLWMVPLFALMIMFSAFEAFVEGSYIGVPCPLVLVGYSIGRLMETTTSLTGRRSPSIAGRW